MMPSDPASDGTLEVLDDLHEDGRRRFVKRRTKEELEEIVVAAWRERDQAKNSNKTSEQVVQGNLEIETPVKHGQQIERHVRDTGVTATIPSSIVSLEAFRRRDTSMQTVQRWKKQEVSPGLALPVNGQIKIEQSPDLMEIPRQLDAPLEINGKPSTAQVDSLPVRLFVSRYAGPISYKSINDLPTEVRSALWQRFHKYYTESEVKISAAQRLIKDPGTYISRPFCVSNQLDHNLRVEQDGRLTSPRSFEHGGVFGLSADDKCIGKGVPCAHLMRTGGHYAIYFVPLPEDARYDACWKDLGFWVLD